MEEDEDLTKLAGAVVSAPFSSSPSGLDCRKSCDTADLPKEGLVKPPLAIPPPPVFELEAIQEEEAQAANSAQASKPGQAQQLAFESQLSASLQPEEAEAAQTALPSDDDDWTEVEAEVNSSDPFVPLQRAFHIQLSSHSIKAGLCTPHVRHAHS